MPPGTPLYEGSHNLWSRSWVSDFMDPEPPLGETNGARRWDSGSQGGQQPFAVTVGTRACIEKGERAIPAPGAETINGYPPGCFEARRLPHPFLTLRDFDVQAKKWRVLCAEILSLTYSDPAAGVALAQAFLGPGATIVSVANSASVIPGSIIATHADYTCAWISGSSNDVQRAFQVGNAIVGMTRLPQYGTLALWQTAAVRIMQRIFDAGADATKPLILAGHSYGGVCASLTGATKLWNLPNADVRILSFGSPRPGDIRLHRLLQRGTNCHLANLGDPIPSFPPNSVDLLSVAWFLPLDVANRFARFQPAPGRVVLLPNGSVRPGAARTINSDVLFTATRQALTGGPYDPFAAHSIDVYHARLLLST